MGISSHPDILELMESSIPAFECFSNKTRCDIMIMLSNEGPMNVGDITGRGKLSRPAVSHHLKILKDAGLLEIENRGNEHYYSVTIMSFLDKMELIIKKFRTDCKNLK